MTQIVIDPEISNLCRSLTDEERAGLEASIAAEGCRDALVVWGDVLLDGHNRHEICNTLGIEPRMAQVVGVETREQAINWVINNQLARRNLSPIEASYLRGKRYNAEKMPDDERIHKASSAGVAARMGIEPSGEKNHKVKTRDRLAAELGVGSQQIRSDAAFATAVDSIAQNVGEEAAREIRSGKTKLPKQTVRSIGKLPAAEQKKALQQAKKGKSVRPKPVAPQHDLIPGDLGQFVMWLRAGSMYASRFQSGAALRAYAAEHQVALREDHISEIYELLSGLVAAMKADQAA